jgi:hypothetical protein
MIFNLMVIPKVLLIRLLAPWAAVIRAKRKSLWAVYIPYVEGVSEKFKRIRN